MKISRIALPTIAIAACGIVLAAAPAFACTSLATLNLDPAVGAAGSVIEANAAHFSPGGSQIVVRWNSLSGPIVWAGSPDANGGAAFQFVVPTAPSGYYVVIASQASSIVPQGGSGIARAQLTIPASPAMAPPSGTVGSPAGQESSTSNVASVPNVPQMNAASGASTLPATDSGPQASPVDGVEVPTVPAPAGETQGNAAPSHAGNGYRDEAAQQPVQRPAVARRSLPALGTAMPIGTVSLLVAAGALGLGALACGIALALRSGLLPALVRRRSDGSDSRTMGH